MPVALRLFLPEEWTGDAARCARAGVPEAATTPASKGEIALAELDRVRAAGVRFGCVLADAGYGMSGAFRHGLDARGLRWAVGIPKTQKVYDIDVRLVSPQGRARKPVPDKEPRAAEDVLAEQSWRRATWRHGTKGRLAARFAAIRIRVADGPVWGNNRHLPGQEAWLVGEWRTSGERKYYLSNLPLRTSVRALAAAIKARWVCEQAHQQLKGETGAGPLRGPLLDRPAPARPDDLHCLCLLAAPAPRPDRTGRGRGKMHPHVPGPPPSPSLPAVRRAILAKLFAPTAPPVQCPCCKHQFQPSLEPKVPK